MAKLVIKLNDEIMDHVELEQGIMKLGRKPECEIVLDNLAVSGEHAHIFTVGDDSFLQDLDSTNGTFVNKHRVTKHHLRHGDIIGIGQHALIYLRTSVRPNENADSDYTQTMVLDRAAVEAETARAAAAAVETRPAAALHVMNGKTTRRRIELTKAVTNLGKTGRAAGSIAQTEDGYVLRPAGKGDKPKVNGRAVAADGVRLRNGDIIEVAGTRLQFYLK